MKKLLVFLALFIATSSVAMASFSDVPEDFPQYEAINWLQDQGVVVGYEYGNFKPDQYVNRAEFLKMLYETLDQDTYSDVELPFPDVPEDEWYIKYVKEAYTTGVIDGYPDGTFKPDNSINLAEALKIITNAFFDVESLYGDGSDFTYCPTGVLDFEYLLSPDYLAQIDQESWYWMYTHVAGEMCLFDFPLDAYGIGGLWMDGSVDRGDMAELLYRAKTVKDNELGYYTEEYVPDDIMWKQATPSIAIYKTKEDYSSYFSIGLSEDGSAVACYPNKGSTSIMELNDGYLTYGGFCSYKNPVYTTILVDEWNEMSYEERPTSDEMMDMILEDDPFVEFYSCNNVINTWMTEEEIIEDANTLIDEGRLNECEAMHDSRIVLTPDILWEYSGDSEYCVAEEVAPSDADTSAVYSDYGITLNIPYNSDWGSPDFRVDPYWNFAEYIDFGPIRAQALEGPCYWYRDYSMTLVTPQTAAEVVQELENDHELFNIEPEIITVGDYEVVKYEAEGLCGEGALVVIGMDYNYKFKALCYTSEEEFSYLEDIIESAEVYTTEG